MSLSQVDRSKWLVKSTPTEPFYVSGSFVRGPSPKMNQQEIVIKCASSKFAELTAANLNAVWQKHGEVLAYLVANAKPDAEPETTADALNAAK